MGSTSAYTSCSVAARALCPLVEQRERSGIVWLLFLRCFFDFSQLKNCRISKGKTKCNTCDTRAWLIFLGTCTPWCTACTEARVILKFDINYWNAISLKLEM